MVKTAPPKYALLAPDLVKHYRPHEDKVFLWHTVKHGFKESLASIAKHHRIPVETLIEFNFPGSVTRGGVDPHVVNWYLFHHERTRCRHITQNGHNYTFHGGEKIAIPYLGHVSAGEPVFLIPVNTAFKIKQHANLNVSADVAADFSIFQIWDEKAGKCSFYTYWAGGVSGSALPGFLSGTMTGPWNDFVVSKPMAVNQFTGATRFTTAGGGSITWNYINFMALPPDTKTDPNPLPIETGFTLGLGAGTSVGVMRLELLGTKDGIVPCKGDK